MREGRLPKSPPFDEGDDACFHWHVEIIPKTKVVSGFECGSGLYINTMSPEETAAYLRGVDV